MRSEIGAMQQVDLAKHALVHLDMSNLDQETMFAGSIILGMENEILAIHNSV